jgi:hypothetical protein
VPVFVSSNLIFIGWDFIQDPISSLNGIFDTSVLRLSKLLEICLVICNFVTWQSSANKGLKSLRNQYLLCVVTNKVHYEGQLCLFIIFICNLSRISSLNG